MVTQTLAHRDPDERLNPLKVISMILLHLAPLGAIFSGFGWFEVGLCIALYYGRMFFVTAAHHRYFAHKTFKLNRFWQFIFAFFATTSLQKGVIWWAAHHRHHHATSDDETDVHSPLRGFFWSHMGWILCNKYDKAPTHLTKELMAYPELRFLDKYYLLPPILLGIAVYFLWGPAALFIGFFLSTVLLSHGTFFINSLAHVFGRRRYVTNDSSRNSFLLTFLTLGEGWHNNHHYYSASTRQGFFWWEIDITYYILWIMSLLGIVKDMRPVPKDVKHSNLVQKGAFDIGTFKIHWRRAQDALLRSKHPDKQFIEHQNTLHRDVEQSHKNAKRLAQLSTLIQRKRSLKS